MACLTPAARAAAPRWSPVLGLVLLLALGFGISAAGAREELPDDVAITDAVSDQLGEDPGVDGDNVFVRARDGIVTLTGVTDSLLARERADRIAQTVKGVRAVVNRLEVRGTPVRAEALEQRILDAFILNPATDSYELGVEVDADGRVTLTGEVDSWKERELAATVAKSVAGVTGVDNLIALAESAERLDAEIEQDIESAMRWDVYLDDALIDVEVEDGAVTLTGTVGSAAEKSRAVTRAWVRGVEGVDAEALEVARWARDEDLRAGKYVTRSDRQLSDAIQDALLRDPRVFLYGIEVRVDNGAAILQGTVENAHAKRVAADVARGTVGVWRVENRLEVVAGEGAKDAQVAVAVRGALERDPYLDPDELAVSVDAGQVLLEGRVDSWFEKARAERVVAEVKGVIDVSNDLSVIDAGEVLTYDPYVDDWYTYDFDWYDPDRTAVKADRVIADDIRDALWWSPFVDADEVVVSVDDGVATLSGTVDTWSERQAATENALEGGAARVVNRLDVDFGPREPAS